MRATAGQAGPCCPHQGHSPAAAAHGEWGRMVAAIRDSHSPRALGKATGTRLGQDRAREVQLVESEMPRHSV